MHEKRRNKLQIYKRDLCLTLTPGLKELQISFSCNNSEGSPVARYSMIDSLQLSKRALVKVQSNVCLLA